MHLGWVDSDFHILPDSARANENLAEADDGTFKTKSTQPRCTSRLCTLHFPGPVSLYLADRGHVVGAVDDACDGEKEVEGGHDVAAQVEVTAAPVLHLPSCRGAVALYGWDMYIAG